MGSLTSLETVLLIIIGILVLFIILILLYYYLKFKHINNDNQGLIKNSSKNQDFYARDEGGIEPESVDAPTETFYDDSIRER